MPVRKKHIERCRELYGYGFEEIHEWMDWTVTSMGREHRAVRHDPSETPEKALEIFGDKVPGGKEKFIEDVVLDHIELDNREQNSEGKKGEKEESSLPNCHNCGKHAPS